MNRHTPSPAVVWPYRPRNTRSAAEPSPRLDRGDDGFDDAAARLAGPGRDLQQTMAAMVRIALAQTDLAH
ncbi:hypothetical protein [Piscinibacter sp.]|jgi:hypothetical protein|uniref:hypothetical protein n=1 Tax=Piscinibacter sp. TaxID=1903157 RepID=UPI001B3ECC8F|nr:hypothetical protein [Piscinibacter sp.]MBK7529349.1 hypothetical protein [Piscinibacter sp.]MBL0092283.1 hypothetical protein [Piscinibacter sp.]MBP6541608.1 hypothetical protein [Piscinibacter sp.]HNW62530.1 hypothetical protein [Piscinibacter sp.]